MAMVDDSSSERQSGKWSCCGKRASGDGCRGWMLRCLAWCAK